MFLIRVYIDVDIEIMLLLSIILIFNIANQICLEIRHGNTKYHRSFHRTYKTIKRSDNNKYTID